MNRLLAAEAAVCMGTVLFATGCGKIVSANTTGDKATGPTPQKILPDMDSNNFRVDHPERFPIVKAGEHYAAPTLDVTGVVSPDVSRQVPVPSLSSGRIVEVNARLGDEVQKGQLLFRVRSGDIAAAYSNYRQAVKNEELTRIQLDRVKLLYEHGAVPKSAVEVAQNAEDDNGVVLETTKEQLEALGADPEHASGIVNVYAPVSGTITDQQITNQAGVQALSGTNPFTISDMSHVWVVCDVWENDMSDVHVGQFAEIRLTAYPDRILKGRISNILPIVDPTIRTAKVRIEVENPGLMRLGMFVTATFHGAVARRFASVPSSAILHLRDRTWVYKPLAGGTFRRVAVDAGNTLPGNMQEVVDGLNPGDQVIGDALVFQNTVEQ